MLPPSKNKPYTIQPDDSKLITKKISDTRLTTVTYSSAIALIGALLFGYAIGYSSPVIGDLSKNKTDHRYLDRNEYKGVFNVRKEIILGHICNVYQCFSGAYANRSFDWCSIGWMVGRLHWTEEILVTVQRPVCYWLDYHYCQSCLRSCYSSTSTAVCWPLFCWYWSWFCFTVCSSKSTMLY